MYLILIIHCPQKQSERTFSIILVKKYLKFGGFNPELTQDTTAVAFPKKPV